MNDIDPPPAGFSQPVRSCANGTTYRTSTVVAIHEQSADMIHFETLNSDYYLSMDPFPMAAVFPAYTALAACA